jgi:hypothetical protein
MTDIWFREFGFDKNPFTIKPAAFDFELVGVNVKNVLSGINDGKILFVEAPLGHGKTTLLKNIVHKFGGKRKVIYIHSVPSEKVDVKDLLKRSSIANYITGSIPTGMILVVDEAQNLTQEDSAEIMEFYKNGNLKAVIFFGTNYSVQSFNKELTQVMNGNVVKLTKPTSEQAIGLVRNRIGNIPLLPNNIISSAYKSANGSPRRLLQICEDLCRKAVENGKLSVTTEELSAIPESSSQTIRPTRPKVKVEARAKTKPKKSTSKNKIKAKTREVILPIEALTAASFANPNPLEEKTKPKKKENNSKLKKKAETTTKKSKTKPKQKKTNKAKPSSTPSSSVNYTVSNYQGTGKQSNSSEAAKEENEGSYWGELMGMQK